WTTNIPTYGRVRYRGIYEGIDLVFYGNQRRLEYDVVVEPGADFGVVRFRYEGVEELRVNDIGELVAVLPSGEELVQRKPHVYQEVDGKKEVIGGEYVVSREGNSYVYSFRVGSYDRRYALFIDPVLSYSTYLGGSFPDVGAAIAVDFSGNAYITGSTSSSDFPSTHGNKSDFYDVFVTKISPDGSTLVYSTYIGGDETDHGYGIAVDSSGNAYITGKTASPFQQGQSPFPTTTGAFQETIGGSFDAFIVKLSPNGDTLVYSTYLGGSDSDRGLAIAIDSSGNAYVTGDTQSSDFPTENPYQPNKGNFEDVFITKINPDGSALVYSTFLGGESTETGADIVVDGSGNVYVTGDTSSDNFPITPGVYQATRKSNDAFVTKLSSDGSSLVYSTYIGGGDVEHAYGISIDPSGNVYITGSTESADFPIIGGFQLSKDLVNDAFVAQLNTDGSSLLYSTFIGGNDEDIGRDIALDASGNVYVTGETLSTNFPTQNPIYASGGGSYDAFVVKIDTTQSGGNSLLFSTYLGGSDQDFGYGIAVDSIGSVYVTGETQSTDFPTKDPYQPSMAGFNDAFIAKISEPMSTLTVNKPGTGTGTVTSVPVGIDCGTNCIAQFIEGSVVTLNVSSDAGSQFTGWGDDCSSCGTGTSCQITMDTDKTCTASFDISQSPTYVLTVNKTGTGSGTVTSNSPGINCGTDCDETYMAGTSVTLTASPDANTVFMGWGGDCESCGGNESCILSMNENKTCTASFGASSFSITTPSGVEIIVNIKGGGFKTLPSINLDLPTLPISGNAPHGAIEFTANVSTGLNSLTISVTFPSIPSNARFYKLVNGTYHDINSLVKIEGNTVSFTITDNELYDSNATSGEITDPLVMVTPSGSSDDDFFFGCSTGTSSFPTYLLLLIALTLVHVLRKRPNEN
ncbi:SBBP repeat-containing protein, partial [Hydrogenivirga sp.]